MYCFARVQFDHVASFDIWDPTYPFCVGHAWYTILEKFNTFYKSLSLVCVSCYFCGFVSIVMASHFHFFFKRVCQTKRLLCIVCQVYLSNYNIFIIISIFPIISDSLGNFTASTDELHLGAQMAQYWANFAGSGDPNIAAVSIVLDQVGNMVH